MHVETGLFLSSVCDEEQKYAIFDHVTIDYHIRLNSSQQKTSHQFSSSNARLKEMLIRKSLTIPPPPPISPNSLYYNKTTNSSP